MGGDGTAVSRRWIARRLSFALGSLCCLLVGAVAFGAAPAFAELQYPFVSQQTGDGTPAAPLEELLPQSVAVDGKTGDTLIADAGFGHGAGTVQQFDNSGSYVATWHGSDTPAGKFAGRFLNIAADDTSGDVYVLDEAGAVVDVFDSSGKYLSTWTGSNTPALGFSHPTGITVDQATRDVYVLDPGNNAIYVFDALGNYLSEISGSVIPEAGRLPMSESPTAIAVDHAAGHLFIVDALYQVVREFDIDGKYAATWTGSNTPAGTFFTGHVSLAVDETSGRITSGNVYVAMGKEKLVDVLDPAGEYLGQISGVATPRGSFLQASSVTVDQTNGNVLVSDSLQEQELFDHASVDTFGTPILVPTVATREVSGLAPTSTTVNGTVNPSGQQVTDCHFEYGLTTAYRHQVPCAQSPASIGSGIADVPVSADLTGLQPDTTYHFRLVASDAQGTNQSADGTFATTGAPSVCAESSTNVTQSEATAQARIDPHGFDTTYHFEYGPTTAYGTSLPIPDADVGTGIECLEVAAVLPALQAGVTYHYRVVATNSQGTKLGSDQTFTTIPAAQIDSVSATLVSSTAETLTTKINPLGHDTTYHFEYGPTTAYGTSVPVPDEDIGEGSEDVTRSQKISGLEAGKTYHYRVVATNSLGTARSGDHTFVYETTGEGLPDNRAYEMVTSPHKNAALIGDVSITGLAPDFSEDGERVMLPAIQCFGASESCDSDGQPVGAPFLFSRTSTRWVATPLAPPASQIEVSQPIGFKASSQIGLFEAPSPSGSGKDFFLRLPTGMFVDTAPVAPPRAISGGYVASSDFAHVIYTSGAQAYEFATNGSATRGPVGASGALGTSDLISKCGTDVGNASGSAVPGMMSQDGEIVYFIAHQCTSGTGANAGVPVPANAIYARIGTGAPVKISGHSTANCVTEACQTAPTANAEFEGASLNGSKAFFTSGQQLTDDASEGGGPNLYEYDFANTSGHELLDVSAGDTSGPRVQGVVAISSDGSHVYFVAKGVLTSSPNQLEQTAHDGSENLYVFERDSTFPSGHLAFITEMAETDEPQWEHSRSANVTPDGRFLVFESQAALTPDDTRADGAEQIFRYDAQTGKLERISIGQDGFNDNGNAGFGNASTVPALLSYGHGPARLDPTMSHDGSRIFFESPIALTPHALNDVPIGNHGGATTYASNIYEWHEGQVSLISDGRDTAAKGPGGSESAVGLLGSDATGSNVFFSTADPLVPTDTDTQIDYYDARICTAASPCISPAVPPLPPCTGEACHGTPAGTPGVPVAPTASFNGQGNVTPSPLASPKHLTRAQTLARALKACHAKHNRRKRKSCEARANRRYGSAHKARRVWSRRGAHR